MRKCLFVRFVIIFFCFCIFKIESTELPQEKSEGFSKSYLKLLEQPPTRAFIQDLLSKYWRVSEMPVGWIAPILDTLALYSDEPEFALHLIQEKFPDLTDPDSSFFVHYKGARSAKYSTFSQAVAPHVKGPVLVDIGGESTSLAELLMIQVPSLEKVVVTDINPVKQQPNHQNIEFVWQSRPDKTPIKPHSVNTVIMTTVLHHIDPCVRLKLLIHIKEILKEGGRLVILEDSYPEELSKMKNLSSLEARFLAFDGKQKKDILSFLDWWGNRLMKNSRDIPLPCTFKSMDDWKILFEEIGLVLVEARFLGIPDIHAHVMAPKSLLVFEKKSCPVASLKHQEANVSPVVESIVRADSNREMMAFAPLMGVNINVSISGSKIQACVVDRELNKLVSLEEYYWRHALMAGERNELLQAEERRGWMVEQIAKQIVAAKTALKRKFQDHYSIEGIGIAWGGPVKPGGKVIGPNIYGFRFQDLTLKERMEGGIDLAYLVKKKLQGSLLERECSIQLLNDGDAAAISNFKKIQKDDGFLLTMGAGIGSGIVSQGAVLYTIEDFDDRIGEIGHHIVYHPERSHYFYYGVLSRGKIWERMTPYSLSERLAGPGLARKFLTILRSDYRSCEGGTSDYLNSLSQIRFSSMELAACEENRDLGPVVEKKLIKFINSKAREGDPCAVSYIQEVGYELGLGLGVFIEQFQNQPYVKQLILSGTMGRIFGKEVVDELGEDDFLAHILKGIRWSLEHHEEILNTLFLQELEEIIQTP